MSYRAVAITYSDVWEWDIILVHGDVKIVGRNYAHLNNCALSFGASCTCGYGEPKMTSPILTDLGKRLHEDMYEPLGPEGTGEAHYLLDAKDGDVVPVLSGKTYRLCGPRVPSDGSIWDRLVPPDPKPRWWHFFRRFA